MIQHRQKIRSVFFLFCFLFLSKNSFADFPKNYFIDKDRILRIQSQKDRWIANDKYKHFVASAFLMGISYNMLRVEGKITRKKSLILSCSFSFSLGALKEWRDSKRRNSVASLKDLAVDILGIGLGILCFTDRVRY
jgi:uncharacterized protein YfiM (DUF2279 family)